MDLYGTGAQDVTRERLKQGGVVGVPGVNKPESIPPYLHPFLWFVGGLGGGGWWLLNTARSLRWNRKFVGDELLILDRSGYEMIPLVIGVVFCAGSLALASRVLATRGRPILGLHVVGEFILYGKIIFELPLVIAIRRKRDFNTFISRWRRWVLLLLFCPILVSLLMGGVLHYSHRSVYVGGVRIVTPGSVTAHVWKSLLNVSTNCQVGRRRFTYRALFRNGETFNLLRNDLTGIDALVRIDHIIDARKKIGITFEKASECAARWPSQKERDQVLGLLVKAPSEAGGEGRKEKYQLKTHWASFRNTSGNSELVACTTIVDTWRTQTELDAAERRFASAQSETQGEHQRVPLMTSCDIAFPGRRPHFICNMKRSEEKRRVASVSVGLYGLENGINISSYRASCEQDGGTVTDIVEVTSR